MFNTPNQESDWKNVNVNVGEKPSVSVNVGNRPFPIGSNLGTNVNMNISREEKIVPKVVQGNTQGRVIVAKTPTTTKKKK